MIQFREERTALHALNEEMGRALRVGPAPLTSRREAATDPLVVCGLIGGKDVGKSALVNALAGLEVSQDRDEIGEGTAGVVAYVHEADEAHLRSRLQLMPQASGGGAGAPAALEAIVRHKADALRGLALLDLPDVTSTFESHADIVRAIAPLLDRVVWLWDPVLAGDRLYAERIGPVVKDHANLWFTLNKVDLLARDEARPGTSPDGLWTGWLEWFGSMARTAFDESGLGGDGESPRRLFMVAAAFPTADRFVHSIERAWNDPGLKRHADAAATIARLGERAAADLVGLRQALLTPISREDAARIKAANAAAETASDRALIEGHFKLSDLAAFAREAPEQVEADFHQHFGAGFVETIAERLARRGMSVAELAERVLSIRIQAWPLLPAVYWLIRAPVRWLGRRIMAETSPQRGDDLMRVDGVPLRHRVDAFLARIVARQACLLDSFRESPEMPRAERMAARAQAEVEEAHGDVERGIVRESLSRRRGPGAIKRGFIWFVMAWFVLLQPLLEGVLRILGAEDDVVASLDVGMLLHAAAIVVTTLGAAALLKGLGATLLVYVLMLMGMYGVAVRDVQRVRGERGGGAAFGGEEPEAGRAYAERVSAAIREVVLGPALEPFLVMGARIEGWCLRSRDPREAVESADMARA